MLGLCKGLVEQVLCQACDGEAITVKGDKQVVEARNETLSNLGCFAFMLPPHAVGGLLMSSSAWCVRARHPVD